MALASSAEEISHFEFWYFQDGSPLDATSSISAAGDAIGSVRESDLVATDQSLSYQTGAHYGYYYSGLLWQIHYSVFFSSFAFPTPPQFCVYLTIAYSQVMMVPSGNWTTKGTMLPVMGWNFSIPWVFFALYCLWMWTFGFSFCWVWFCLFVCLLFCFVDPDYWMNRFFNFWM